MRARASEYTVRYVYVDFLIFLAEVMFIKG